MASQGTIQRIRDMAHAIHKRVYAAALQLVGCALLHRILDGRLPSGYFQDFASAGTGY